MWLKKRNVSRTETYILNMWMQRYKNHRKQKYILVYKFIYLVFFKEVYYNSYFSCQEGT